MEINLKVSKLANQFFFISNLSEWHFSCDSKYNEKWIEMTGVLNKEETSALKSFSEIMKRYGFQHDKNWKSKFLGQYFYLYQEKQAWEELKKAIKENEFNDLKEIFKTFNPSFEKIWKLKDQDDRVKILEQSLKDKNYKLLLEDTEKIFGNSTDNTVNIIILFSPLGCDETGSGGANIGSKNVTFKIPALKADTWQMDYTMGVLAHEIGHMLFKDHGTQLIQSVIEKIKLPLEIENMSMNNTVSIINEAITESFVPVGYLGQKYAKTNIAPLLLNNLGEAQSILEDIKKGKQIDYRSYRQLNKYLVWQLYPLATQYGRNKKPIDEYFVEKVGLLVKGILK
ncbi:hypothetical protein D4R87_02870 [bacterium]|nr:MAG: hypothetical protein D4R87_02870 [bacterium]